MRAGGLQPPWRIVASPVMDPQQREGGTLSLRDRAWTRRRPKTDKKTGAITSDEELRSGISLGPGGRIPFALKPSRLFPSSPRKRGIPWVFPSSAASSPLSLASSPGPPTASLPSCPRSSAPSVSPSELNCSKRGRHELSPGAPQKERIRMPNIPGGLVVSVVGIINGAINGIAPQVLVFLRSLGAPV